MSFYRNVIAAVATMGLATCVFAQDAATTPAAPGDTTTQTTNAQPADATPAPAATTTTTTTTSDTTTTTDKVDLNKASVKELMKVKGLNAAKAKALVTYRKKNGDFKSVEEIKNVKGFKRMNEKVLQDIEDQLTV